MRYTGASWSVGSIPRYDDIVSLGQWLVETIERLASHYHGVARSQFLKVLHVGRKMPRQGSSLTYDSVLRDRSDQRDYYTATFAAM